MAAIDVHELRKDYAAFHAVDSLSFEVAEGEIFALLGPNRREDDDNRDP